MLLKKFVPKTRIFLVGCPRSGTTLLQSMLATHEAIASFPESEFFTHLFPHEYEHRRRRLGVNSRWTKKRLEQFLRESGHEEMMKLLPATPLLTSLYTSKFISILDKLTKDRGKNIWLEKSPQHLHHIEWIEKYIRGVKFIHILRNGEDAVASMYEARSNYPKDWPAEPADIDLAIKRWLKDVQIDLTYQDRANHKLVKYEQLLAEPKVVLAKLCQFIGVEFDEKMLQDYSKTSKQLILEREPWKASVGEPIKKTNSVKFYKLFDAEQREYIQNQISAVNLPEIF